MDIEILEVCEICKFENTRQTTEVGDAVEFCLVIRTDTSALDYDSIGVDPIKGAGSCRHQSKMLCHRIWESSCNAIIEFLVPNERACSIEYN